MKKILLIIFVFILIFSFSFADVSQELMKKVENGDRRAQFEVGVKYYQAEDYKKALKWFKKSANQGHQVAPYNLGFMYYHGKGVSKNLKKALKWYKKSSDAGNFKGQYQLALMYDFGRGTPKNYKKAYKYYKLSAKKGYRPAQHNLGIMYINGKGVYYEKNIINYFCIYFNIFFFICRCISGVNEKS